MGAASRIAIAAMTLLALAGACGDDPTVDPPAADAGPDGGTDTAVDGPVTARFGLDARPANPSCRAPARPPSAAPVRYERVFANVDLGDEIMGMEQRPGDRSRWYVAQRGGRIVRFDVAALPPGDAGPPLEPVVVADVAVLAGVAVQTIVEAGLLGMAFHPKFGTSGRLFVSWISVDTKSRIGYLTSTDGGDTFTQYTEVLQFDRFAFNHCGGTVLFGPDGFLYASFGDGGSQDNIYNFGQSTTGFQSKILRIDVDNPPAGQMYGIPEGNPFKNGGGEPATYARGFRNPFRFSIDRATGDVWAGDVGEDEWEEVDRVVPGGNYGWSCREGAHDHHAGVNLERCPPGITGLIDPVFELRQVTISTRAIIGGNVYRGKAIPSLAGTYLFADFVPGELYALTFDPVTGAPKPTIVNPDGPSGVFQGFAEDVDGETYVYGDAVHKLVASAPGGPSTFPDLLSKTGCFDPGDAKRPAPGLVPYTVNASLWSDGAEKERYLAIPDGTTITTKPDGDFDFPNGTVLAKTFSLGGKRIETRLFMRHDDGGWSGYSYEWNDAQTDATLLPAGKAKAVGSQSWSFPSRSDCLRCHTEAAGRSLGLELGQLDRDFLYASTNRISNQLATLEHIGMFAAPLPTSRPVFPDPAGTTPVEGRARAYLHANCSHCHRPGGPGGGDMDLRFATPLRDTKTCNVSPRTGDLGIVDAKLLAPGVPNRSILSVRPRSPLVKRMPPLASSVVDPTGTKAVDDWIAGLASCP